MTSTPEPGLRDANGRRSEMLVDLLQCATIIYEIFAEDRAKAMAELLEGEDASRDVYLAGDDFLPIFIFVVVHSSLPELPVVLQFMRALCDPDLLAGKGGYYLTVLESVIQCVQNYDANEGTISKPVSGRES